MSKPDHTPNWATHPAFNRTAGKCTRCGQSPIAGRGLCSYHYGLLRRTEHYKGTFVSSYVPIGPTRDHLNALRDSGIGWPRISQLTGVPLMTLTRLCNPGRVRVARRIADMIADIEVPDRRAAAPAHAPGARILITGSRRRIRALAAIGYPQDYLLERIPGMTVGNNGLSKVYSGNQHPYITAQRARDITALYNELRHSSGPSRRALLDAKRKGWSPPWCWDDATIDDPAAVPDAEHARHAQKRRAAVRAEWAAHLDDVAADLRLVGRIRTDADEAAFLGITVDGLQKRRCRAALNPSDEQEIAS